MNSDEPVPAIIFDAVDILFGDRQAEALALLDKGGERDRILAETGTVVGVADASMTVGEGQISVLMGLSGSGKSTLLRAVNRLNPVARGGVRVRDKDKMVDVATANAETLRDLRRHRVAMVFQQFALLPWRSVAENVGFGLELSGVAAAKRQEKVQSVLELVGLTAWQDKYAHELSGGMQQRVGLARAFATDADILLMDEPYSALDPLIREHLQDALIDLQNRLNKTILFVSHDLDEALKLGDRITIMQGGRIIQHGKPQDVILNPANDYVAEFVQHMNPLKALTAETVMTPLSSLSRNAAGLPVLDAATGLSLDTPFEAAKGRLGERTVTLSATSVNTRLQQIIGLKNECGYPVLICDADKPVGVVGDREIYRGILLERSA